MKLRIRGNSIRLRLTQTEVAQLAAEGRVNSAISFGNAELRYTVGANRNDQQVKADLIDSEIIVRVPEKTIAAWAASEQVGIEGMQTAGDDELHILIEKDFACLTPRAGEDDTDTFVNPLASAK